MNAPRGIRGAAMAVAGIGLVAGAVAVSGNTTAPGGTSTLAATQPATSIAAGHALTVTCAGRG